MKCLRDKRTAKQVLEFIKKEHFHYRRDPNAKPDTNEHDLSGGVCISISAPKSQTRDQRNWIQP